MSPLAQAQRESEIVSIERFISQIGGVAQISPTVIDNVDIDEVAKQLAEKQNVISILRKPQEVKKLREERAEAAEAQRQQAIQEQLNMVQATEQAKVQANES